MRRLLGMAFLGLTPLLVVLTLGSALVPVRGAEADPEAPVGAPTPGSLTRYQARLESEAAQVFETTVTDPLRRPSRRKGVALWATASVADWSRVVTEAAPSLASVVDALGQRSRVLWREERVIDAYDSLILQLATVHAMQRGLFRIVDGTAGRPRRRRRRPRPRRSSPRLAPAPAAPVIPSVLPEPRSTAPTARPVPAPAPFRAPAPAPAPTPTLDPSLDYAMSAPAPSPDLGRRAPGGAGRPARFPTPRVPTQVGRLGRPRRRPTPFPRRPGSSRSRRAGSSRRAAGRCGRRR